MLVSKHIDNMEKSDTSMLSIGDTLTFTCYDGYEMDGLSILECLEDGSLSDLPPICQPIPCSTPPM